MELRGRGGTTAAVAISTNLCFSDKCLTSLSFPFYFSLSFFFFLLFVLQVLSTF